jgi:hypothetical protein
MAEVPIEGREGSEPFSLPLVFAELIVPVQSHSILLTNMGSVNSGRVCCLQPKVAFKDANQGLRVPAIRAWQKAVPFSRLFVIRCLSKHLAGVYFMSLRSSYNCDF